MPNTRRYTTAVLPMVTHSPEGVADYVAPAERNSWVTAEPPYFSAFRNAVLSNRSLRIDVRAMLQQNLDNVALTPSCCYD